VRVQEIEYHADGVRLVGTLAVDDSRAGKRPGILIGHEGLGITEHPKRSARRLAEAGYVAFALDYFGDGQPLADPTREAMPRIQAWLADPTGIRERAHAALEVLTAQSETDASRLGGIGYCYGGTTVLEMARAGEPLAAVVGFHSGLATARPAQKGALKAKVLVQIGSADPIIPPEQRLAFEKEMTEAGADWRLLLYGGAGHAFTNPEVDAMNIPGFAYEKATEERSWRAMLDLFDEVF
jgi:dienelactone hydrolase